MVKLDIKDKKILYELDTNSRKSIPQFRKNIGLHKNALFVCQLKDIFPSFKGKNTPGVIWNY